SPATDDSLGAGFGRGLRQSNPVSWATRNALSALAYLPEELVMQPWYASQYAERHTSEGAGGNFVPALQAWNPFGTSEAEQATNSDEKRQELREQGLLDSRSEEHT